MVIASLLVTPTEQQQQQTTTTDDQTPEEAPATVQYEAWRVRVIQGPHALQFQKGKLWPQGEKQYVYAQRSFEYLRLIGWLAENSQASASSAYKQYAAEARALKQQLDAAVVDFKKNGEEAPVEAVVREIHELNGNVYIIGAAFGDMNYAPIEDIPKSACIVSRRITEEAFPDFILVLRELAAIEASLVDGDDEEEEEEEIEEEEDDEPEEETTADVVVDAASALVASATNIEVRPEGPVVLVAAAAWEPLCQAVAAHLTAMNGDPDEAEGTETETPAPAGVPT